jgi:hypothetical protein
MQVNYQLAANGWWDFIGVVRRKSFYVPWSFNEDLTEYLNRVTKIIIVAL